MKINICDLNHGFIFLNFNLLIYKDHKKKIKKSMGEVKTCTFLHSKISNRFFKPFIALF